MKFLQVPYDKGNLINTAHIEMLQCLPRYGCKNGQDILSNWVVEVILTSGGCVALGPFRSERDAKNYLNDLVVKLGVEVVTEDAKDVKVVEEYSEVDKE